MVVQYFGDTGATHATSFAYGDTLLAHTKNDTSYDALPRQGHFTIEPGATIITGWVITSKRLNTLYRLQNCLTRCTTPCSPACCIPIFQTSIQHEMNDTAKTTEYTLKAVHLAENWNNDELTVTTLLELFRQSCHYRSLQGTNENSTVHGPYKTGQPPISKVIIT